MPSDPALNNYTKKSSQGFNGGYWDSCSKWWPGDAGVSSMPEHAAWICNQFDDCDGFSSASDPNNKSWVNFYFKSGNAGRSITTSGFHNDTSRDTYVKNGAVRKAYQPNVFNSANGTGDPSILSNPSSKVFFNNGTTFGTNRVGVSGAQGSNNIYTTNWGSQNTQNPDYGCCNNMHDVNVPFGWRFFVGDNGTMAGCGGGAAAYFNQGDGQWHHIADGAWDDGVLVENRGFDVETNWDSMATQGIVPDDELQIKKNWCQIQSPSLMVSNKSRCTGTTSTGVQILDDSHFNQNLVNACLADSSMNWASQASVTNQLKSIILNGKDTDGHVLGLFQTYCRGDPTNPKSTTGHRTDYKCACINAADFGFTGTSNCFDAPQSSFPGCATYQIGTNPKPYVGLKDRVGPIFALPRNLTGQAINSLGNAPGCVTEACILAQTVDQNQQTLPYQAASCPALNIQICGIQIDVGAAQDSPINAQCSQSQIINPPGSSPSSGSSGTPSSPGTPPPPGSPDSTSLPVPALGNLGLDTPGKQYGGIGGCIFLICICCVLILLVVSSGGDEGGGGSDLASLIAARSALAGA